MTYRAALIGCGSIGKAHGDGKAGARWLVCSRCDARWLFKRLQCPHCGNQSVDRLCYLASEDCVYRLYLCDSCRGYLKVVDLRKAAGEVLLPLERLLTLDLDRQAHELGYGPGDTRDLPAAGA